MRDADKPRVVSFDNFAIDSLESITPQPPVNSDRIKDLLSRGLTRPHSLSSEEVREMTAAVVYHLLSANSKIAEE